MSSTRTTYAVATVLALLLAGTVAHMNAPVQAAALADGTVADSRAGKESAALLKGISTRYGATAATVVVDARDVLKNPREVLTALCAFLYVPFDEAMLSWPPGRRATDGVWAKHWYEAVERQWRISRRVMRWPRSSISNMP